MDCLTQSTDWVWVKMKNIFFQIFLLCWDWGEDKVRRAFISEAVNFRKDTASGDKQANDRFVFYFKQRNSELSKLVQKCVKSFVFSKLMFFMWKSSLLSELVQIFISTCVNFVCTIWRMAGFCTETILNSIIVLFLGSAMGRELNQCSASSAGIVCYTLWQIISVICFGRWCWGLL